jgi:Ferritin-like domain
MTYEYHADRRSFLKAGAVASAAIAAGTTFAEEARVHGITKGDIAILRFLSAVEQVESDLWEQYNELGGIQDKEVSSGSGNKPYTKALKVLDGDMDQYIHDNTDDEFTHHDFLNAFLVSIGANPIDLSKFRTLNGSTAKGSSGKKRLTNLMQLTVDTSWWTRYRDPKHNPDCDGFGVFANAVPSLAKGRFPAIPRSDADATLDSSGNPSTHTQAIANTAAFHFAFIEVGGTSLYPTLALRVTNPVVLRILLSIGPTETMHFQTWQDKAGNAPAITDPTNGLTFPDLAGSTNELLKANLIMPEPCPFLCDLKPKKTFPAVSIIRPVSIDPNIFGAVQAAKGLAADGLFIGHEKDGLVNLLLELAEEADEAQRQC